MITQEQIDLFKQYVADTCFLISIELEDSSGVKNIYNYCNYDIPVVDYETNIIFEPISFDVKLKENTMSLSIDTIEIIFDNVKQFGSSVFLNKDQRGNKVDIYISLLDEKGNSQVNLPVFSGRISSLSLDLEKLKLIVKHELLYWNNVTLRYHSFDMFPNMKDLESNTLMKWGRK